MKNKGTIAALLVILLAGVGLFFAFRGQDQAPPPAPPDTTASELWHSSASTSTATTTGTEPMTKSGYPYDYPGIVPAVAAVPADPYMICVNRQFALPSGYSDNVSLAVCVEIYPENLEMERTAAARYLAMYDAAKADGAELVPYSGFRSTQHQKNNFDRKIQSLVGQGYTREQAVNMTALTINPPGCSEHETGLAMDITRPGVWDAVDSFKDSREYAWLMAHAQDYGFILRYPEGKKDVTQVEYEPWHWRYVGVENAKAIKASGKCLEEYLGVN